MNSERIARRGWFSGWLDALNPYNPDQLERDGFKPGAAGTDLRRLFDGV